MRSSPHQEARAWRQRGFFNGLLGWTGNQLTGLGFGIVLAASAAVETGFNGWAALPERESVAACRTLG